jgi:hypothetical protein
MARRGVSRLGCLVGLLVLAAVAYFGINVGEVYWRYYEYKDSMQQAVNFADRISDEEIAARLRAKADSLGLPEEAQQVAVSRQGRHIGVSAAYEERVELPGFVRTFPFSPSAESDF